jgi:hypothetical protein
MAASPRIFYWIASKFVINKSASQLHIVRILHCWEFCAHKILTPFSKILGSCPLIV